MKVTLRNQYTRKPPHRMAVSTISKQYGVQSTSNQKSDGTGMEPIEIDSKEPLVIYQNDYQDKGKQTLVIFVHGLSGSRFDTWQKFPQFLQEELPYVDVGMYEYATARSRFFRKTPKVPDQAQTLAHVIRDEKDYRHIFLIGHSMGGVMHMGAIQYLLRTEEEALDNIKGLFLMATPQLGSRKVPWLTRLLSKDARVLYPYNDYLNQIHETFANHINPFAMRTMTKSGKTIRQLPIFVVTADRDMLVDKLSTGPWIPTSQKRHVRGSHTSIVKPDRKTSDAYLWVRKQIVACVPDLSSESSAQVV